MHNLMLRSLTRQAQLTTPPTYTVTTKAASSRVEGKIFKTLVGEMMRISGKAKELAELKYIRLAQEISARHYAKIKGHETMMPRGGAMKATIDNEHLTMAQEIAEA